MMKMVLGGGCSRRQTSMIEQMSIRGHPLLAVFIEEEEEEHEGCMRLALT